jgi:hypothetical protein
MKTGLPFGLIMGLIFSLSSRWKVGMSSGLVSGLVFGSGLAGFMALNASVPPAHHLYFRDRLSAMTALPIISLNREGVGGWLTRFQARRSASCRGRGP